MLYYISGQSTNTIKNIMKNQFHNSWIRTTPTG